MGTETFGQRFRRLRQKAGLTHKQVAQHLGVSQPRIAQMEKEEDVSVSRAQKLAVLLKVELSVLLGTKK